MRKKAISVGVVGVTRTSSVVSVEEVMVSVRGRTQVERSEEASARVVKPETEGFKKSTSPGEPGKVRKAVRV